MGLEALSRGASAVLLVESDPAAVRSLRSNVDAVGLPGAEVVTGRVERVVSRRSGSAAYDLVFADPPYEVADDDLRAVLAEQNADYLEKA